MTIAHKTKLSALIVALMVAAATLLVPSPSASAGDGAFTLAGTAHLSDGIGSNSNEPGCLGGLAVGAHGTDPALAEPAFAGFTYNNPDTIAGDATGHLKIGGVEVGFDWQRTGVVATVEFTTTKGDHVGNAVAAFAPVDAALFECNGKTNNNYGHGSWSGDEHAQVVGVGVIGH